ncbi:MAG: class I SAM-dependent methyltransferase [Roseicyclus sp.]|nr:class I SAM-dependent methyltransferase [Roseicyclus sp.]MBO6625170.1 class I SAM-dependent methyltransferase [Roseicyclus sp.]MBO6924014.1 class I SAM-dependent methyltransferase [Roseicyclus sp.]
MNIRKYRFAGEDIRADIRDRIGYDGPLLDIYAAHDGTVVNKWHHYLPLYDRYFARFRGTAVRFLEIGVSKGGSLEMWRDYFGPDAQITGIDIDPACAQYDGHAARVRIGSQDDPAFLAQVVDEMSGLDLVLDDGSHRMEHIETSLRTLFPSLAPDGVYAIEDLHTAYWRRYGGGFGNRANFFNTVRSMIDRMHRWYHDHEAQTVDIGAPVGGIHIHDSFVVLDRGLDAPPVHSKIGTA